MKPGGGKNKGHSFEWLVCRRLSRWATGTKEDIFVPSSGSGSVATHTPSDMRIFGGDIVAVDPRGVALVQKFTIECKHHASLETDRWLADPEKSKLASFWKQAIKQTINGRRPLLIAKQNHKPVQLIMAWPSPAYIYRHRIHVRTESLNVVLYQLEEFLAANSYEDFIKS